MHKAIQPKKTACAIIFVLFPANKRYAQLLPFNETHRKRFVLAEEEGFVYMRATSLSLVRTYADRGLAGRPNPSNPPRTVHWHCALLR
jgi:hypothetical protein